MFRVLSGGARWSGPSAVVSTLDFQRISAVWLSLLQADGIPLPTVALRELDRRIAEGGNKSKLSFRKCRLSDAQAIKLIEALAMKPSISKLDLTGNDIGEATIAVLIRLLKGQLKLLRSVPLDERLEVAFLGQVLLDTGRLSVSDNKLRLVVALTDCLKYVNVQSAIRRVWLSNGAPELMDQLFVESFWAAMFGGLLDKEVVTMLLSRSPAGVVYEELESAMLAFKVRKKMLPRLADW